MKLLDDWKNVLKQAWSVKTSALAALFGGMQQAMPFIPPSLMGLTLEQATMIGAVFGALGVLFATLVPVVRVVDQGIKDSND